MLDNFLAFIYSYGIVVIILLLIAKVVMYFSWVNRKKNIAHLFYIDEKRIFRTKTNRELFSIKVQNFLGIAILCLMALWLLIAAFIIK